MVKRALPHAGFCENHKCYKLFRVISTRINSLTLRLAVRVVNVDVHGAMQGADQGGLVSTHRLVSSVNGFCLPVGPIDVLLKQRHGKNVGDVILENCQTHKQ